MCVRALGHIIAKEENFATLNPGVVPTMLHYSVQREEDIIGSYEYLASVVVDTDNNTILLYSISKFVRK